MDKKQKRQKKLDKYRPDFYYSAFWNIDFNELSERGIKNLIIDVDSTIAHNDSGEIEPRVKDILKKVLDDGTIERACLVSNTMAGKRKEERVARMARELDIPYVAAKFFFRKPNKKPFLMGLEYMNAQPGETAVIGDQIFTDVLGGNRLGMMTVLVKPLGKVHWSTIYTLRRFRERLLLRKMKKELDDKVES